ncbi:hypothetical protein SprV_0602217300 [Sparganum proliferum]
MREVDLFTDNYNVDEVPKTDPVVLTENIVQQVSLNLKETTPTGPDEIPTMLSKELVTELAGPLCLLFQASLDASRLPPEWKTACISPIYKSGSRAPANNYRPGCEVWRNGAAPFTAKVSSSLPTRQDKIDFYHGEKVIGTFPCASGLRAVVGTTVMNGKASSINSEDGLVEPPLSEVAEILRTFSKNIILLPQTDELREMQTVLRDKRTTRNDFVFYANRLIRLVMEEGLNQLPFEEVTVITPTG